MLLKTKLFWNGIEETPRDNVAIEIQDDKITAVKSALTSSEKPDIDIDGFLMPGLVDCHTHIVMNGSPDPMKDFKNATTADFTARALENLQKNLKCGVTTIRDMGSTDDIDIMFSRLDRNDSTRIHPAGRIMCIPGGHGHDVALIVEGPESGAEHTRNLIKSGARHIKIVATGGIITEGVEPGKAELTPDEIRAICDTAREAGLLVSAHAQGNEGILNALENGVTFIEHGFHLNKRAIALLKDPAKAFTPTFSACNHILENADKGIPEYMISKLKPHIEAQKKSFRMALEAGVNILAGTDAGTPFNPHGGVLHEVAYLIENGMNPVDALKSATSLPSKLFGLNDRGSLTEGKLADMVAFEKDLIKDLDPGTQPTLVIKDGLRIS